LKDLLKKEVCDSDICQKISYREYQIIVVPSIMLDVQYRMHPSISRFPSLEFYDFALQDGTVDSSGNIHPMLLPPLSSHLEQNILTGHRPSVVFIDHGGAETLKDRSRVNWNEAHIVCSIVEDLLLQNEVSTAWLASMSD
jgi:superfamily I DNA and/or RNA helicase